MTRAFTIRKALIADIPSLMKIERESFREAAFSSRQMNYLVSGAKGVFLVSEKKANIVGYISVLVSDRHKTGRIYSVAVDTSYRGMGIADQLILEAIDYCMNLQLRKIFLEVRMNNKPAISLYEKNGFIKRAIKKNYYGMNEDAYAMQLDL